VPPEARARIAVLVSGGGSNLQALIDHFDRRGDARAADVALVIASRSGTGALERATRRGVPAGVVPPGDGDALARALRDADVDLVVLAGYMFLVPEIVTRAYEGRMLNVHPALLPAFGGKGLYGARVHRAVLASGARVSGATVHFVDADYDRGPIAAQWPVPVFAGDSAETLAARVLRVEHLLLPRVVERVARGDISLDGSGRVTGTALPSHAVFTPDSCSDEQLGARMDAFLSPTTQ
jgi:phosphoribosylglycinamide formyltransferase 1